MEGEVTVTDSSGHTIFYGNIWVLLALCVFSDRFSFDLTDARIFIDLEEVFKPESFEDDT